MWGWQAIILGAVLTLPFGITQSKEYAELEWFLDIGVVVVWVAFAINFFWTLAIRNEKHLYVAIWFYISTVITIALLYIVNNLALPVSMTKSYGIFSGAQDALTQWWYGHNAVAFFLTTPILGIMYYFLPKAANRPIYSYRLSIVHFWGLVFIYIWAGPHHLLYTALPEWAQSLGMIFSLMLWAPSWGGMLNGLLTLRGAWDKVRSDPVLKFFVAAVTFYGMATFEGPLLAIKSVSALGHYTDWIIGHVHSGALGWNGFMAAGLFYWLVPKLYGVKLHSVTLANWHFYIGMLGILFYVAAMWVSGITSGLMWRATTADGALQYQSWVEMVDKIMPMYYLRALGGSLFILGWVLMVWNLWKTARSGSVVEASAEVAVLEHVVSENEPTTRGLVLGSPFVLTVLGLLFGYFMSFGEPGLAGVGVIGLAMLCVFVAFKLKFASTDGKFAWHNILERRPLAFCILVALAVMVGGLVQLLPGIIINKEVPMTAGGQIAVAPYTPLELTGRDVYVREGCYTCHSQMIRPFLEEQERYGDPSRIEESMWDHPFQWGSKRTGPDLARIGSGRQNKPHSWHYLHMQDPRAVVEGSNMPRFPWLRTNKIDPELAVTKIKAMKALGVPYTKGDILDAPGALRAQAEEVANELARQLGAGAGGKLQDIDPNTEIVALIAYLQRLGKNQRPVQTAVRK
jgi:cytochrome c oxidase cbb3-type subunit I/II